MDSSVTVAVEGETSHRRGSPDTVDPCECNGDSEAPAGKGDSEACTPVTTINTFAIC